MKRICECVLDFFKREWSPAEKILLVLVCFLSGVIHGFLWAPIKKGISCGNYNGNTYSKPEEEE